MSQVVVGTVLLLIGSALPEMGTYVKRQVVGDRPPTRLDDVTPFLSRDELVMKRIDTDLGGSRVPEAVLVTVGSPDEDGDAPGRVLVIGWDGVARRWTSLFDSARRRYGYPPKPILAPDDVDPSGVQIVPFEDRPGHRALGVNANLRSGQVMFVLTLDEHVVGVGFELRNRNRGSLALTGSAPHQTLRVGTTVETFYGTVRSRTVEVSPVHEPGLGVYYAAVADDQAWLGAYLGVDDKLGAVVAAVDSDSPAATSLVPGDVIAGLTDVGWQHGSDIVMALAGRYPQDVVALRVLRDGRERQETVTLGSLLERQAFNAPREPMLGAQFESTPRGVVVRDRYGDGRSLKRVDLDVGDRIVRVGTMKVRRVADLYRALLDTYGMSQPVTVVRDGGTRRVRLEFEAVEFGDPKLADEKVLHMA